MKYDRLLPCYNWFLLKITYEKDIFFTCTFCVLTLFAKAQPSVKLNYFTKVPASFKSCGALYTYDTVSFQKKKYILLTDFQNLGLITINGKQIQLQLSNTKTVDKANIHMYKGSGYTVVLTTTTTSHIQETYIETGTLQVINGIKKLTIKVHGQSGCNESKQEGNS